MKGRIENLRSELDTVDGDIVRLVAARLDLVGRIAREKASLPGDIRDPERERKVLERVETTARELGISAPLARKIFAEIIAHSVARQGATLGAGTGADPPREITVTFQGSPHTYGYLAGQKYVASLGLRARFVGVPTIFEAASELLSGAANLAFVPIENTMAGSFNQIYDLLREHELSIVGEETYKVDLSLAGIADVPLGSLQKILSHPLALEQCGQFIRALTGCRAVACVDTAEAMRAVAAGGDPTQAAIGSPEAAAACGLTILRRGIANQEENITRYVALARGPERFDQRITCKTSLILSTRHEQGALLRCLTILSDWGLSLTKLESRPRPNRPWEYMFFVDFEGNVTDPRVASALDDLRVAALYLKVLGSYPAKATPAEALAGGMSRPADLTTRVADANTAQPSSPVGDSAVAAAAAAAPPGADAASKPPAPARRSKQYKLADRASRQADTVVRVGDLLIGGDGFTVMAGPCSVESEAQIQATARHVREHGAHVLRGGVFKPRTSPYAFQGLGHQGLDLLAAAGKSVGIPIITEVMSPDQVRPVAEKADILQIGARNMQNFPLLNEVGKVDRPVLLKRGLSSTIEEWLAAAEYILAQGNGQVILCERGIRTFESATRNTLDLSAVVVLRERTHLPVVVDPSHGTGRRAYVASMAYAARACGAHGLLIEVHPDPDKALSDGDQSLTFPEFSGLMEGLRRLRL